MIQFSSTPYPTSQPLQIEIPTYSSSIATVGGLPLHFPPLYDRVGTRGWGKIGGDWGEGVAVPLQDQMVLSRSFSAFGIGK